MLFGLTLLELCDFVAGCGYSVQLAFMPEDFCAQTFEGTITPAATIMCQYSGVFILGMLGIQTLSFLAKSDATKGIYAVKALTWGLCGLLTAKHWEASKKPNVYVNMGLQIFFTTAWAMSAAVA